MRIVLLGVLMVAMIGCASGDQIGDPGEYFPLRTGCRWEYDISIGDVEPVFQRTVSWPLSNGMVAFYKVTGRFLPLVDDSSQKKTFELVISILSPAKKQGPYEWHGFLVNIEQDELGIYRNAKQVFWAISRGQRFMAQEVRIFDSTDSPTMGGWGYWGIEDGFSDQLLFIGAKPYIGLRPSGNPDIIIFLGPSSDSTIKFLRKYEEDEDEDEENGVSNARRKKGEEDNFFENNFSEELVYKKNVGLLQLIQRINGNISMTWRLASYYIPPPAE